MDPARKSRWSWTCRRSRSRFRINSEVESIHSLLGWIVRRINTPNIRTDFPRAQQLLLEKKKSKPQIRLNCYVDSAEKVGGEISRQGSAEDVSASQFAKEPVHFWSKLNRETFGRPSAWSGSRVGRDATRRIPVANQRTTETYGLNACVVGEPSWTEPNSMRCSPPQPHTPYSRGKPAHNWAEAVRCKHSSVSKSNYSSVSVLEPTPGTA